MTSSPSRLRDARRMLPALIFLLAFLNFLSPPASADGIQEFVMPTDGYLSIQFIVGEAAADTTFGLGTSPTDFIALLTGLPNSPSSLNPINAGFFTAGTTIHMGMSTEFGGTYWAFSNGTDFASLEAFSDRNNSLGFGGSIIQQTGPSTYVLHLDDAASQDDDDNDVLIRLTVSSKVSTTPEPGTALLILSGGVLVAWRARTGLRPNEANQNC